MPRARETGLGIGRLPTGPTNSVLDVAGVGLGHVTLVRDEQPPPTGRGSARTGVTTLLLAEDAYHRQLAAGGAVLNGAGECTGFLTAGEWGAIETPLYLTSTMQLGRVYDAACEIALEQHPEVADDVVIPVVAECDDSFLNDCRRMQVTTDDVRASYAAALASRGSAAPPEEGAVGAGTGMSCLGHKGGIGTSSRLTPDGHTVAVLLLTNFGERHRLTVAGVPVGRLLPEGPPAPPRPAGSCIGVVVTDAPVDAAGCSRLARRVGLGLARTGSTAHHGSGEIFLAASTTARADRAGAPAAGPRLAGRALDPLFEAVVDASEEAVLNSLLGAPTTVGRDGNTSEGLDPEAVLALVREGGRAGTERDVVLTMADGVGIAATLYLPDAGAGPQPCLLEALPYRKDDLTSSYAESYRRLRDEFGYAICRVDVRGTGSSGGDATDEYPSAEQSDLVEVIAWLAAQEWCDGGVGMWGTSYSGFNSLQVACERPPALKAICAIYATDDRWTDDVHWRGGARKLVDLVDYCHYMTPMCMLPPVPAVWGDGWREEWRRRLETQEPWLLTWLRENRDGPYWRHGSVRLGPDGGGYDRIDCAVMIVAGWADGYRNNSFRTVAALREAGVPHRLLAGPWAHADPTTAMPGPRIDLDIEMTRWFDRWLRGTGAQDPHEDGVEVFVRGSTVPAPDLDLHAGRWIRDEWPSPASATELRRVDGPRTLAVDPDTGTAAWIDCAGHLPWGQSGDQREDDARSLRWEWTGDREVLVGHPRLRLRVSADAPTASLSAKLCDVFPDGTSALITRGSVDLAYRDGLHAATPPSPLVPGHEYDVVLELDACAYELAAGQRLRLSIAGADWPNTVAPPTPVRLTVHEGTLELPLWHGPGRPPGTYVPGASTSSEDPTGVSWTITRDVLAHTTTCAVRHGSTYDVPHDGRATERYAGEVSVDRQTFAQRAEAECSFILSWPGVEVLVRSSLGVDVGPDGYDVVIDVQAHEGGVLVAQRSWAEHLPR